MADLVKKSQVENRLGFFLAGAGGLGLVATTQSRVFDFGFATLLGLPRL